MVTYDKNCWPGFNVFVSVFIKATHFSFHNNILFFFTQLNETLQVFRINGNKIGNKGVMAIAGSLQVNAVLQELDISDTDMVGSVIYTIFKYI